MSHYTGKNHAKKRRAYDAQNATAAAAAAGPQEQLQQVHVPGQGNTFPLRTITGFPRYMREIGPKKYARM